MLLLVQDCALSSDCTASTAAHKHLCVATEQNCEIGVLAGLMIMLPLLGRWRTRR